MKIVTVIGARPQFIKAFEELNQSFNREVIKEIMVHTGQHYDFEMSKVFFEQLELDEPDYHLFVGSGTHGWQTGEMLKRVENVLMKEKPDMVLVFGDTNSTAAGALASAKLHIPVAHVEAGLRSFNKMMPEEINRVLTDQLSSYLFCPTENAVKNLSTEGISDGIHLVGDVMYDSLILNLKNINEKSQILENLRLRSGEYILATVHRAGNVDNRRNLSSIMTVFNNLKETVVFPVHPRTRAAMFALNFSPNLNLYMIDPVSYIDMLNLEKNARIILTDSGGVQKEAYLMGVPCLTLREETEWVETVEAGWNRLVGIDPDKIRESIETIRPNGINPPLFGDGRSSEKIAQILGNRDKRLKDGMASNN